MATLSFILALIVLAGTLTPGQTSCASDYQSCVDKFVTSTDKDAVCRGGRNAVNCLHDLVLNSKDCSASTKADMQNEIDKSNQILRDAGCAKLTNAQTDQCLQDAINCKPAFRDEVCRFASKVSACISSISNNQTSCPQDSQQVDQYTRIFNEHNCSVVVPQNGCYANITGCVDKFSSEKLELCRTFYTAGYCIYNSYLYNNLCSKDSKQQIYSLLKTYENELNNHYGCSAVADKCNLDMGNCIQVLQQEVCRLGSKVLTCAASVSNNQTSCPEDSLSVFRYNRLFILHNCSLFVPQNTCYSHITDCIDKFSSDIQAQYRSFNTARDCLNRDVMDNSLCPPDLKISIRDAMDQFDCQLQKVYGSSGVSSLMSSLALTLALSALVYLLTSLK